MDDHNIEWEEGHHTEEKILDADEVIKSPVLVRKTGRNGAIFFRNRICCVSCQ